MQFQLRVVDQPMGQSLMGSGHGRRTRPISLASTPLTDLLANPLTESVYRPL